MSCLFLCISGGFGSIAVLTCFDRAGGMPAYIKALHDSLENGFQGWKTDVGSLGVESLSVG